MDRFEKTFNRLKKEGRKGLVAYLTAGDPDFDASEADIRSAINYGIDILELGVPFSDPTADGPTIQEAAQRALAAGMTLDKTLELTRRIRRDTDIPIVLFGYLNPFFRYGYEKLCNDAKAAGADGFLVVDLTFEESGELYPHLVAHGLDLIPLIAPTTPESRAQQILSRAGGFVYYIMVTGVTGARDHLAADINEHITTLRKITSLPIAVGFGISSGEQARQAAENADAVVVGSALIRAARAGQLAPFVQSIRHALG